MPTRRTQSYQYKPDDDPVTVANQFGITPQQLLGANPGGAPFSTGQTINIPFQYSAPTPTIQYNAPIGPQPAPSLLQQRMAQPVTSVPGLNQQGRGIQGLDQLNAINNVNAMRGRGFGQDSPAGPMVMGNWVEPTQPALDPTRPYGGFERAGKDNTDYANTATARYYEAAGTPFLQQQRWDPQRRRFVSIGRLLRQGKLDLKGNWHRRGNRQRANDALARRRDQKQQQTQDFTLANSLINFSVSSG